jgi:hypothetical protein
MYEIENFLKRFSLTFVFGSSKITVVTLILVKHWQQLQVLHVETLIYFCVYQEQK